jgi:hypothetical protein
MPKYSIGCTKIEMGAIAGDGGMGTTLASVGEIYQGTAQFTGEAPNITDHFSEQSDDPMVSISVRGKQQVKFTIVDVTPANLVLFLGGTASGTNPAFKWDSPLTAPSIEQSLKITTTQGYTIAIPRAKISANINWMLGKTDLAKVEVTAMIMTPTKAATASVQLTLA